MAAHSRPVPVATWGRNKTAASMLGVLDTTAPGQSIATGLFLSAPFVVAVGTNLQQAHQRLLARASLLET